MMQACLDIFAKEGTSREVTGNHPLRLDDPESVWLVDSGWVDIFVVPLKSGQAVGARTHLARVRSGQLLFGQQNSATGCSGLLAVGTPDSRVVQLPLARLRESAREIATARPVAALLDSWVCALTSGIVQGPIPRPFYLLEPGMDGWFEAGVLTAPARTTLWVRHLDTATHFLGKEELLLEPTDGLFPLTEPGWLTASDEGSITAMPTETLLTDPDLWTGLRRFHRVVLTCAALNAQEAVLGNQARLQSKTEAERRLVRTTLYRLAAITRPEEADGALPGPEEDSVLATCHLLGARLGLTFHAPKTGGRSLQGTDRVRAIARVSGVRVRRVLLDGDWWRQDNGPLLAFRASDERPVALLPTSPSSYELADAVSGERRPVTAADAADLMAFAHSFYRPFPARALGLWDIMRCGLADSRRDWVFVLVMGLAAGGLEMLVPFATAWLFDWIIPEAKRSQLGLVVLALAVSAVVAALFQLTQGIGLLRLETRMESNVEAGIWDRLLNLPAPFFREYSAGDLAVRAMGISQVRQALTDVAFSSVLTLVFSLVSFALLFYYDVRLAAVASALFFLIVGVTSVAAVIQLRYERELSQLRGRIAGLVLQMLTGISRLRVAGAENLALAVWAREFGRQKGLAFRARTAANRLAAFNAAVPVVASLLLFGSFTLLPRRDISLGVFLAFNAAYVQVLFAAVMMSSAVSSVLQIIPLYERAGPILRTWPEVDPARVAPGELTGDIEISHVSFRYSPEGPVVLDDVSAHIRPGEFVAFVGPSGAGKSTVLRLLLGFETPTAGSISYDREDLALLDRQAVRRQTGVVLQNSKLTPGDLLTNIIGSSLLTLDDAWEAARVSGLDEDIMEMPMGMYTVISEGESTLSGGQRQRLMIARAVVAKPRILLFDEATSALDNATQARIIQSLEWFKATRIVVAHRLSTIRHADRIYVLEGGKLVQQGCYDDLIKQPGLFADLAKRQMV